MNDIERWRELEAKRTSGIWGYNFENIHAPDDLWIARPYWARSRNGDANAAHIVHCVNTYADLVARVEAAEEQVERLKQGETCDYCKKPTKIVAKS